MNPIQPFGADQRALNLPECQLDFGEVGYYDRKERFCIRLSAKPLADLIEAAQQSWRTYELFLINRPTDCWAYLEVIAEALPAEVTARLEHSQAQNRSDLSLTLERFDRLFYDGEELSPPDETWFFARRANRLWDYVWGLFGQITKARQALCEQSSDPLISHIVALAHRKQHPLDRLPRKEARQHGRIYAHTPAHSEGFYQTLQACLDDPAVRAVAYRGDGDCHVLRMLATTQRRRMVAGAITDPDDAIVLNALVNRPISEDAWDTRIRFYWEGLGYGDDLYIDGGGLSGTPIRDLVVAGHRRPDRYILNVTDEGEIPGYTRQVGQGFVLYRRIAS